MVTGLSPFIIPAIPQMIQDHGGMRGEAGGERMTLWETNGAECAVIGNFAGHWLVKTIQGTTGWMQIGKGGGQAP